MRYGLLYGSPERIRLEGYSLNAQVRAFRTLVEGRGAAYEVVRPVALTMSREGPSQNLEGLDLRLRLKAAGPSILLFIYHEYEPRALASALEE